MNTLPSLSGSLPLLLIMTTLWLPACSLDDAIASLRGDEPAPAVVAQAAPVAVAPAAVAAPAPTTEELLMDHVWTLTNREHKNMVGVMDMHYFPDNRGKAELTITVSSPTKRIYRRKIDEVTMEIPIKMVVSFEYKVARGKLYYTPIDTRSWIDDISLDGQDTQSFLKEHPKMGHLSRNQIKRYDKRIKKRMERLHKKLKKEMKKSPMFAEGETFADEILSIDATSLKTKDGKGKVEVYKAK